MSKCNYDPIAANSRAQGMYHCPECGEMVLASVAHPDYELLVEKISREDRLENLLMIIRHDAEFQASKQYHDLNITVPWKNLCDQIDLFLELHKK